MRSGSEWYALDVISRQTSIGADSSAGAGAGAGAGGVGAGGGGNAGGDAGGGADTSAIAMYNNEEVNPTAKLVQLAAMQNSTCVLRALLRLGLLSTSTDKVRLH